MRPTCCPSYRRWSSIFLVLSLLIGCSSSDDSGTDPTDPPDLSESAEVVEATMENFLGGNEAVESISGLSSSMVSGCGGSAPAVVESIARVAPGGLGLGAFRFDEPTGAQDSESQAVPASCQGETLELDPGSGEYVVSGASGAPSSGVRFTLYEVDGSGAPTLPLDDIGHLDITDNSSGSTARGRIVAVVDGETLIDLSGGATITESSASFDADGFFSDGTDRMDVEMQSSLSDSGNQSSLSLSAELSTSGLSIASGLVGSASLETGAVTGTFTSTIRQDGRIVEFQGDVDESGDVSGSVEVNGEVVATFSLNLETGSTQVVDASGGELSQADIAALEDMFEASLASFGPVITIGLLPLLITG